MYTRVMVNQTKRLKGYKNSGKMGIITRKNYIYLKIIIGGKGILPI